MALLEVREVTVRFGGITALSDVSFDIAAGEIVGLIGPNGAGKTSLFNVVSRLYEPDSGDVRYDGETILDLEDHRIAGLGIGRTFQNIALFPSLDVLENVVLGHAPRVKNGPVSALLLTPSSRTEQRDLREQARRTLHRLGLSDITGERVDVLPQGQRRQVELARALMAEPRLLLLDEPAAGLNPAEMSEVAELLRAVNDEGVAMLVIEHRMDFVLPVADRVVVLDFGRVIADGHPEDISEDPAVIAAYLGVGS